jgi:hypothetical protein
MKKVLGISSKNGALHELRVMRSKGKYQLHSGATAADRKRSTPTLCTTIDEAIAHIRNGLHPRMMNVSQKGQAPDIMSPNSLVLLVQQKDGSWSQEKI